jgi:hypothetical protein
MPLVPRCQLLPLPLNSTSPGSTPPCCPLSAQLVAKKVKGKVAVDRLPLRKQIKQFLKVESHVDGSSPMVTLAQKDQRLIPLNTKVFQACCQISSLPFSPSLSWDYLAFDFKIYPQENFI